MQLKLIVALIFTDIILQNTEVKRMCSYNASFL